MEIRHLAYFAAAAETGSISRAATRLGTSQPSVSRQIRTLEKELGVSLLRRSANGVRTTPAGEGLLRHYQRVSAEIARVPEVVEAAFEGKEFVRVGLPPGLPSTWFLGVLTGLREEYPNVELDLVDLSSPEQERALGRSRLDLAFMHHTPSGYRSTHVLRQTLGVALRPGRHRFRSARTLTELDGARILAHTSWEVSGQISVLEKVSQAAGVTIDWRFRQFGEHVGLMAASTQADGILITEATAARFVYPWPWVAIEVAGDRPIYLDTWAVHPTPAMLAVEAVVDRAVRTPAEWQLRLPPDGAVLTTTGHDRPVRDHEF